MTEAPALADGALPDGARSAAAPALPELAITGATGTVGRLTAEELARGGAALRLLARDSARAPQLPRAAIMACTYCDDELARAALVGVRTLLMVSADEEPQWLEQQLGFVAAAVDAGVEHIVYLSTQGASATSTFTFGRSHFATEEAIRASGMAWTILRSAFPLDLVALLPGADDTVQGPAGEGRVAAVAKLDVARAAAAVLRDPAAHAGRTYELTGPRALSFHEIAATLTAATGRRIRYLDETVEEGRRWRAATGASEMRVEAWVSTYTAIAAGENEHVSGDVELLTGRPPVALEELVGL
ncbi:NAD(P)H-binding protein [Agrococcus sp. Marseille-P2731]|uniref:NAD(P)H-binding protein n=1 Tax=Agrococcus sp. Marseille-P2731 TaxID=1841862 RepID=UPI0009304010|nr:NAD(P)H-binding protein [Agrococcus sp. Marseille-P2731]